MDRLDRLELFARIVEGGSFARAARDLNVARSTATNAINLLERETGVRLLARTTLHDGQIVQMQGVRALGPSDVLLHQGDVDFLYDELAEVFHCWWVRDSLPVAIWEQLDMGVRRRLVDDPHFRADARVQGFADGFEIVGP